MIEIVTDFKEVDGTTDEDLVSTSISNGESEAESLQGEIEALDSSIEISGMFVII